MAIRISCSYCTFIAEMSCLAANVYICGNWDCCQIITTIEEKDS